MKTRALDLGDIFAVTCTSDIRRGTVGEGVSGEWKFLVRSRTGFVKNKEAVSLVLQFLYGVGSLIYRRTKKLSIVT